MKAITWKMFGAIGLVLGLIFAIAGYWLYLSESLQLGVQSYYSTLEWHHYGMPMLILGVIFLVFGCGFLLRGLAERSP